MSSTHLLPQLDLTSTFGALFIGVTCAALIFGITNVQTFIYFQTNKGTGMTLYKLAVIWLWILDAFHLAIIIHSVYYYLVSNYGNTNVLTDLVWSFQLQVVLDFLIVFGIYVLYAHRVWIFSSGRSRTLAIIVGTSLITTPSVGFVVTWEVYHCRTFSELIVKNWLAYMALGTITCNDLIIALSLSYLLVTSRTGFSRSTDTLLTKLMVYVLNTGALTSVTSMIAIITCATMQRSFISFAVQFIVVKLYVTSFLALMNARNYLQPEHFDNVELARTHHPSLQVNVEVLQHSYDCNNELYSTHSMQAIMRPDACKEGSSIVSS